MKNLCWSSAGVDLDAYCLLCNDGGPGRPGRQHLAKAVPSTGPTSTG